MSSVSNKKVIIGVGYVCACVHVRIWGRVTASIWRSEDGLWNQLSSSVFMWAPGMGLRSPGFLSKCLYLISHLASPC